MILIFDKFSLCKDTQNIKIQKFDSHMKSFVVGSKSNCSDVYNYNVTIISRINR